MQHYIQTHLQGLHLPFRPRFPCSIHPRIPGFRGAALLSQVLKQCQDQSPRPRFCHRTTGIPQNHIGPRWAMEHLRLFMGKPWENHRKTIGKPQENAGLLCGKHTKNYGTSQFLMGKSTISMAIFNSELLVYQGVVILRVILSRWKTWDIFKPF